MTGQAPIPIGRLVEVPVLASTMDEARALVVDGQADVIGVRAGHQTRGRGTRRAIWADSPGQALLVTYIVRELPNPRPARLAFAGGVAVAAAVEELTGLRCGLKWPNDVLLDGRKLAGVLVETIGTGSGFCALVGIGLNVNQSAFPDDLASSTSLRIAAGRTLDVQQVERAARRAVFACICLDWSDALARWRALDATSGRTFYAQVDGGAVTGTAIGVDDEGALLLRLDDGSIAATWSASTDAARG